MSFGQIITYFYRSWRGGFLQIRNEIMTNEALQDFRQDFGLDSPNLSKTPTIMEILGDHKLYLGTYRYTPGMDGTIVIANHEYPELTTAVERNIYEGFYKQQDHSVDTMDLMVLQNDPREPVLEVLVQMEGNTFPAEMSASLGSMLPNWNTSRQKFTEQGEPYYRKENGQLLTGQPVILGIGTPKASTPIYAAQERTHFLNVISHTETTEDDKTEVKVRIMQRYAGQQANTWENRKEQIQYHLRDQTVINQQLNLEKSTYMNPLQVRRNDGSYGAPLYSKLMPPEYTSWVTEGKASHDYR